MSSEFSDVLQAAGWKVRVTSQEFPSEITERYPTLPRQVKSFLEAIAEAANPDDTAWFVTPSSVRAPDAFRWNEWEIASLTAAEADPTWQKEIRQFWDEHFPILLSVADGYAYVAVVVSGADVGQIIWGREPEFEVVTPLAPDFTSFQALMVNTLRGGGDAPELAAIIGTASN